MSQETSAPHQPPFDVPSVEEMAALLPQYAFEKLAAFGGMGAVYKARQQSLDRPVAIKILPPEFGAEPEFAERFKAEARAMAKLNHTNIVAVYDFGITKSGHFYLVMEWVEGHTLHEIIHKGCVPARKAAHFAAQLCDALAYAHSHRILHRDIKPGNIMVNEDDQVKVADFGLARPITGEAEENPYGTPDYAAPEILGKGGVDQRADIFAAGIVLYEMLTGRVPQKPRRSVTEHAALSPKWDGLIDKATHPDPEKRFQDAREFRAHIMMLVNQAAQAVAVPVEEEKPRPKPALAPLHMVLIGTAVVVLGIVLGGIFQSGPEMTKSEETKTDQAVDEKPKGKKPKKETADITGQNKKEASEKTKSVPEQEPKKPEEPSSPTKNMAAVVPVPTAPPMPTTPATTPVSPPPAPETVADIIQKLEERDPELAKLVDAFGDEWAANPEIETEPKLHELDTKYIPALQRGLPGLAPEQRDHILSEISHIANHEPLNEPDLSWPPVLSSLRKTYLSQVDAIQASATEAAKKMRDAQCEVVLAKARERAAAGKTGAAGLADAVAAELAKLRDRPSLKAIKQGATGAAKIGTSGTAPEADRMR